MKWICPFTNASYCAALEYSVVCCESPRTRVAMVKIWNMALHKIRARSEQRGPQGHTGLAWPSSESHRMGRSGTQVTRKKAIRLAPVPPSMIWQTKSNRSLPAEIRRQVDFNGGNLLIAPDCAKKTWTERRLVAMAIASTKHLEKASSRATRVSEVWRRRVQGGLRIRDGLGKGFHPKLHTPLHTSRLLWDEYATRRQLPAALP